MRQSIVHRRRRRTGLAVFACAAATAAAVLAVPALGSLRSANEQPGVAGYAPYKAYYVAKGTIPTEKWAILVYSRQNCMVGDEGQASNFGDPHYCFDRAGGEYAVLQGHTKEKSTIKIDARAVRVIAGGKTYTAPAVATPSTDTTRFFALVIPHRDLNVISVILRWSPRRE
ncbi:hypothetical protein [Kribbella sp. NPDC051718]|uniref:hypothetical protein n=1 Tax=Kribbella sp. NPDC051718 TaxID=3155168 RepID=UPI00342FFF59